jgi:TATA-binding protein-associated factor Taf7
MKFNIKVTRERRFFKRFSKTPTIQRVRQEVEEMLTEHEKLAEKARRIAEMLDELERN